MAKEKNRFYKSNFFDSKGEEPEFVGTDSGPVKLNVSENIDYFFSKVKNKKIRADQMREKIEKSKIPEVVKKVKMERDIPGENVTHEYVYKSHSGKSEAVFRFVYDKGLDPQVSLTTNDFSIPDIGNEEIYAKLYYGAEDAGLDLYVEEDKTSKYGYKYYFTKSGQTTPVISVDNRSRDKRQCCDHISCVYDEDLVSMVKTIMESGRV